MRFLRDSALLCLLATVLAASSAARADDYPTKPIRLIIGSAPGGLTDVLGRFAADHLSRALGQVVIADDRPGAGGNIATGLLAKSAPDGYTILICEVGQLTANVWLYKDFPIDPLNGVIPVATIADGPTIAFLYAELPIHSIKELIEYAKKYPNAISYGSAGIGTSLHLAGDQFNRITGTEMLHVPYRGSGLAVADLAAGRVQVVFMGLPSAMSQLEAGKIRALAVSNLTRLKSLPDVPTFAEAGLPEFEQASWYGFFVPRGTPASVVAVLNRNVNLMLDDPKVLERFETQGILPRKQTPEEFAAEVKADYLKWRDIVSAAGVTIQ